MDYFIKNKLTGEYIHPTPEGTYCLKAEKKGAALWKYRAACLFIWSIDEDNELMLEAL